MTCGIGACLRNRPTDHVYGDLLSVWRFSILMEFIKALANPRLNFLCSKTTLLPRTTLHWAMPDPFRRCCCLFSTRFNGLLMLIGGLFFQCHISLLYHQIGCAKIYFKLFMMSYPIKVKWQVYTRRFAEVCRYFQKYFYYSHVPTGTVESVMFLPCLNFDEHSKADKPLNLEWRLMNFGAAPWLVANMWSFKLAARQALPSSLAILYLWS